MSICQRLSHSSGNYKYHVVLAPKRRCKVLFGQARRQWGEIVHALARQTECQIVQGHLMPDDVHMCIAIPPKYPVASVIGFLKGKSAIAMAACAAGSVISPVSISGPVAMPCPPSDLNCSRFAANRKMRMERLAASSKFVNQDALQRDA